MNKPLSAKELQDIIDNMDVEDGEDADPFADSDDSQDEDYEQSSNEDDSSSDDEDDAPTKVLEDEFSSEDEDKEEENDNETKTPVDNLQGVYDLSRKTEHFVPRKNIPSVKIPAVLANITFNSSEMEAVFKLFPRSLFMYISQCTNERLEILEKSTKKKITKTTTGEIMVVMGCTLVMCYNPLPAFHMYWSNRKSLGNEEIKAAISRDRCQLILSKIYFNNPEKPNDVSKVYYMEEVLSCLKKTFPLARSESTFQSIDETMTKFKGRSTLKQYIPLKPIKRGIKLWTRCDAITDFVYNTNIYSGKETTSVDGTLGERVVQKLVQSVRDADVVFCFDRFFTSVNLMHKVPYAAVGTCMKSRKNVPKFQGTLQRGESESMVCKEGLICSRWQDTKDFLILSNCHNDEIGIIERKMKDGSRKEITCIESIKFYNKYMGGVDHADQMISLYDFNRKSSKWWRKVFYKLFMTAIYNAYIIYSETRRSKKPFIGFLISVAENLIAIGKSEMGKKRVLRRGRPSKRTRYMENVGDHLPMQGNSRRRCVREEDEDIL